MTSLQTAAAWIILAAETVFALWFFFRQNRSQTKAVGGPISVPKALWLAGAIFFWFFYPLIFLLDPQVSAPWKTVLALHLVSWWARGPLELVMIYRWVNWSPRYGITHDLFHILMVLTGLGGALLADQGHPRLADQRVLLLAVVLVTLVCAEALFARLFFAARGKGADLIYFADDSPRYRLINFLTWVFVIEMYGYQLYQLFQT